MPVQEQETKRNEPVGISEDERKKQVVQENTGVRKSGRLLPFLNAKAEHHQSRIDNATSKIAALHVKMGGHKQKIKQLSAKAERLEDQNRMLKAALGNLPLIRRLIEKNEQRIADIREHKIPAREQKIAGCESKIRQQMAKRDRIWHKLSRVIALNSVVKSFSIGKSQTRRKAFADAMQKLNGATFTCLLDKKADLVTQRDELMQAYSDPQTDMSDKFKIQQQIDELSAKIAVLDEKIETICRSETFYLEQGENELEAAITLTEQHLETAAESNEAPTMPELAEGVLNASHKAEELSKTQVAEIAAQSMEQQHKLEELLEDDANMLDGIINNGSKADIDKAKAELTAGIQSMQTIAENPFVSAEMREMAQNNIADMKNQLSVLEEADNVIAENWLSEMLDSGQAELTESGGFKINPEYYVSLPQNERHYESMTEIQAVEVMTELQKQGVQFSAASRQEGAVSITVANKDVSALSQIMQNTVGKTVQRSAVKQPRQEPVQTINPEYYKSLAPSERFTRKESLHTAREIAKELTAQNIPYSALVRPNDTVVLTVSKENAQAFMQLSAQSKGGKTASPQTKQEHAAPKKEGRKSFFSRSSMQKNAQRISGRTQHNSQQKEKKKENQVLF